MTRLTNAEGRALLAGLSSKRKFKGARITRQDLIESNPALAAKILHGYDPDRPQPEEKPKKKKKPAPTFTPRPKEQREGIFIPFNTPSSKNSKRIVRQGERQMLINSELVMWYKKYTLGFWIQHKWDFIRMIRGKEYPLRLQFHYIRDTKRAFDYNNASQVVQDLMVQHGWLPDDNVHFMLPQEPSFEVGDKTCCGVWINVL